MTGQQTLLPVDTSLADRIAAYLVVDGRALSAEAISRALRTRTQSVRMTLLDDERFCVSETEPGRWILKPTPIEVRDAKGRARRPSQADRLLAVLSDHEWHTTGALLRVVPCIVHSRIADLRDRGYLIEHGTTGTGAEGNRYRLLGEIAEAA